MLFEMGANCPPQDVGLKEFHIAERDTQAQRLVPFDDLFAVLSLDGFASTEDQHLGGFVSKYDTDEIRQLVEDRRAREPTWALK